MKRTSKYCVTMPRIQTERCIEKFKENEKILEEKITPTQTYLFL